MKTILNLKIVFAGLLFCLALLNESCDKGLRLSDPAHYLVIKKSNEGTDFFNNNPNYNIDSTQEFNNHSYRGKLIYKQIDGLNRIYWSGNSEDYVFLDYRNGDIDTLKQTWEPNASSRPAIEELNNWKIFFNGKLVKEYDFKNNPSLKEELSKRNCENCNEVGVNPIIIEIKK